MSKVIRTNVKGLRALSMMNEPGKTNLFNYISTKGPSTLKVTEYVIYNTQEGNQRISFKCAYIDNMFTTGSSAFINSFIDILDCIEQDNMSIDNINLQVDTNMSKQGKQYLRCQV